MFLPQVALGLVLCCFIVIFVILLFDIIVFYTDTHSFIF